MFCIAGRFRRIRDGESRCNNLLLFGVPISENEKNEYAVKVMRPFQKYNQYIGDAAMEARMLHALMKEERSA